MTAPRLLPLVLAAAAILVLAWVFTLYDDPRLDLFLADWRIC